MEDIVAVYYPCEKFRRAFLPPELYHLVRTSRIRVCTDILVIDRGKRLVYLTRREIEPMKGLWWLGGERPAGRLKKEAAAEIFRRDTALFFPESKFQHFAQLEIVSEYKGEGCHDLIDLFTVELSQEELGIASASLGPPEYKEGHGLKAFDITALTRSTVRPVILQVWRQLF